ncbi:cytochrome P450 family protein [Pleurotus pulmonarius]
MDNIPIVVALSLVCATDLLEKRSGLYSDRPNLTVYVAMGWDPNLAFLPYGPRFRKHRKLLQSHFSEHGQAKFRPIQLQNACLLAQGLMQNTKGYQHLVGRYTTAIVIRIAYGHQILSDDDIFVQTVHDCGYTLNNGGPPGGTVVDFFPILMQLPSWFPGTYYANFARNWRWAVDKLYNQPYEYVQEQRTKGMAQPSFLLDQLEATSGQTLTDEEIGDIKGSSGVIFGAGAETTWSSLETFLLAMLCYPDVQKKGQEEIDRVIGPDRLPTFDDFESLPYVGCVTQEILRWRPALPIGLPHCSTEDDIYRGMFIPKGSIIFANTMGMVLDDKVYVEPTRFNPGRFLPKSQGGNAEPPLGAAFGFGRRICPGRHLAAGSIWIAVATIFATIDITKVKDEAGNEMIPELEYETGLTSRPKHFPCNTAPRDMGAVIGDEGDQLLQTALGRTRDEFPNYRLRKTRRRMKLLHCRLFGRNRDWIYWLRFDRSGNTLRRRVHSSQVDSLTPSQDICRSQPKDEPPRRTINRQHADGLVPSSWIRVGYVPA